MVDDVSEDVTQVRLGFDAIELSDADQRMDRAVRGVSETLCEAVRLAHGSGRCLSPFLSRVLPHIVPLSATATDSYSSLC